MNPYKHSEISVKKRGGCIEDYYQIHSFLDSTKELCSDNRHRILHNLWGIRRVVIPIFGNVITNSDGKQINVKDLCEQDHILPDYRNKFIPTLSDFVNSIQIKNKELSFIDEVLKTYESEPDICQLLLSPLALTGSIKSLLITHNAWFVFEIIPRIFKQKIKLTNDIPSPDIIFQNMDFKNWMDNGMAFPPSAKKIEEKASIY